MNCFPVKVKAAAAAAFFPFVPLPSVAIEGHSFSTLSLPLSPWLKAREGGREGDKKGPEKKTAKNFHQFFCLLMWPQKILSLAFTLNHIFPNPSPKSLFDLRALKSSGFFAAGFEPGTSLSPIFDAWPHSYSLDSAPSWHSLLYPN